MAENKAVLSPDDCSLIVKMLDALDDRLAVTPYQPEPILFFLWDIPQKYQGELNASARRVLAELQARIPVMAGISACIPALLRCRQGSSISPAPLPGVVGRASIGRPDGYHRVDLACRIALSEPSNYIGGEIVLSGIGQPSRFKPRIGCDILVGQEHLTAIRPIHRGIRDELILYLAFDKGAIEQTQTVLSLIRNGYQKIGHDIVRFSG